MTARGEHIVVHALGAKVGGGVTYLQAVLPELIRALDGRGVRVTVLLPGRLDLPRTPEWMVLRAMPVASRSFLHRLVFDQLLLPALLKRWGATALYCSGSFTPLLSPVRTVTLVRNAIHFDPIFLARDTPRRRLKHRLNGALIALGGRRAEVVHFPTAAMCGLASRAYRSLGRSARVNSYGVRESFLARRPSTGRPRASRPPRFLYVMTYTLQKNLTYVLRALAEARREGLDVQVVVTDWLTQAPPAVGESDRRLIDEYDLVGTGALVPAGPAYGEDLLALYEEVDACLFASFCESFGHPLVEAMALGKPVVCADRPYARELCGDAAIYVDPDDPASLVDVWRRWDQTAAGIDPVPLGNLRSRFSWARHVENLLRDLLGSEPVRSPDTIRSTQMEGIQCSDSKRSATRP